LSLWHILNTIIKDHKYPPHIDLAILSPIVIHLRLGDVIENHKRSVDDFWDGVGYMLRMKYNHSRGNQAEGYIRPKSFYENVCTYLKTNHHDEKRILILTGSHKKNVDGKK
jgi:hypothetical protein